MKDEKRTYYILEHRTYYNSNI